MITTSSSRRRFIKAAGTFAVAGTLGMGLAGCDSGGANEDDDDDPGSLSLEGNTLTVDLSVQTQLKTAGGFLLVRSVGGTSVRAFIVNVDGTDIRALTSVCTHQECDVDTYHTSTGEISCPCHGSRFGVDGSVKGGPAPSPLATFTVSQSGDLLMVSL